MAEQEKSERAVPDKIRLQCDTVDAKGGKCRKGDVCEVGTEAWPKHRALRHLDKGFAVDASEPDVEVEVQTFDDSAGFKDRILGKKKRR